MPGKFVNAKFIVVRLRRSVAGEGFPHGGHQDCGDIENRNLAIGAGRHEPVVDRFHVSQPLRHVSVGEVILGHRGRGGGTGKDHLSNREAAQRIVFVVRLDERPYLRQDVVGGAVRNDQIFIARLIRRGESRGR